MSQKTLEEIFDEAAKKRAEKVHPHSEFKLKIAVDYAQKDVATNFKAGAIFGAQEAWKMAVEILNYNGGADSKFLKDKLDDVCEPGRWGWFLEQEGIRLGILKKEGEGEK